MAECCRLAPATGVVAKGPLIRNTQRAQVSRHTSPAPALPSCRATLSSQGLQGPRAVKIGGRWAQRHLRATPEGVEASEESDDAATEPAQSSASTSAPTPTPSTPVSTRVSPPAYTPPTSSSSSSGSWSTSSSGGDPASREVLDAFFVGRALAEVVLERVGSAVGEFLSDVGRAQAEQQQQIRLFQEEVQARAEEARQKAAKQTKGPRS